jgi:hypothetical protein
MANEMRVIWKTRDKNGMDMLLSVSSEYWLVMKSSFYPDAMMVSNPSIDDLELLQKALTSELSKNERKK